MEPALSNDFVNAFLQAYEQARLKFDEEEWREVWGVGGTHRWSHHMLWDDQAVLKATAKSLDLAVGAGEPLRLDAVFVRPEIPSARGRFPIQVALEHENAPWTFETEIRVLLAVRAPLKVGITYALSDQRRPPSEIMRWLTERIRFEFDRANSAIGEDPKTEYLFLLGEEHAEENFVLTWKVLSFTAASGAETAVFKDATAIPAPKPSSQARPT